MRPLYLILFLLAAVFHTTAGAADQPIWEPFPIRSEYEAEKGLVGGEGHQHMRGMDRSPTDPDRIYIGIDVAGTWRSEDGGESWIKNTDKGLHNFNIQTLAVDPEDPDRLFVIAAAPKYALTHKGHLVGIYLSEDRGESWTLVKPLAFPYEHKRFQRIYRRIIAPGAVANGNRIWYAAADEGPIYRSADNGVTWSVWAERIGSAEEQAYYTLVPMTGGDSGETVLAGSTNGLHRYHDKNGNGRIEPGEVTQLPVPEAVANPVQHYGDNFGFGVSGVLVHPERPDDIVAVRRNGSSYRTQNGGAAADDWQEVPVVQSPDSIRGYIETFANKLLDGFGGNGPLSGRLAGKPAGIALNGFQDPFRADNRWMISRRAIYKAHYEGTDMYWVPLDGSKFETKPYLMEPITRNFNNEHSAILFHPTEPWDMVSYKFIPWRFDVERDAWVYANDYFTGIAWTLESTGARWVAPGTYPQWDGQPGIVFFANDIGPLVSRNDGESFTMIGGKIMDTSGRGRCGAAWGTSTTGDIDPNNPDHLIALIGKVGWRGFNLCRSLDGGETWEMTPKVDRKSKFNRLNYRYTKTARFIGDHPATGGLVAVAGKMMSLDADAAEPAWVRVRFENGPNGEEQWPKMPDLAKLDDQSDPGFTVLAVSGEKADPDAMPTLWAANDGGSQVILIGRPNPAAEAGEQPYRWQPVFNDWRYNLKGAIDGSPTLAGDPHDKNRLYFTVYLDTGRNDGDETISSETRYTDNEIWLARIDASDLTKDVGWDSPHVEKIQLTGPGITDLVETIPTSIQAIRAIAPDPLEKDTVFIGLMANGVSNVYRVRFPSSQRLLSQVTDLSGNLARDGMGSISVRPDTGDIYVGTHFGTWRLKRSQIPN